jgi:hypothetical protein
MNRRVIAAFLCLVTVRLAADGTPCDLRTGSLLAPGTKLTGLGGQKQFSYDDLALAFLDSPGVVERKPCGGSVNPPDCLFVPLYEASHSCTVKNFGPCREDGRPDDYTFCMVTDEFSQLGLILVMSTDPRAIAAFQEWVNTVRQLSAGANTGFLPAWRARVTINVNGTASIERNTDDDASDGTARIILALYIAASAPHHAARRADYELLANVLANRFAHYDFRDTRNRYGAGRFWLGGGKNAAANALTNLHPFTFAGYYGDVALAMIAAYQSSGETRYAKLAEDAIANYLRAAGFIGAFRVPPMKFSWTLGATPQSVCRDGCDVDPRPGCDNFCDLEKWDADDAPRAVNVCKAAYYMGVGEVPIDAAVRGSLDSYCRAWMASDGVTNNHHDYARQYTWAGSWTGSKSSDYANAGLGAALNFYLCPDDLLRRLAAPATAYDVDQRLFKDESCLGVYRHAFWAVNYGSGTGRDLRAFEPPLEAPANLAVAASGGTDALSWNGSAGAAQYEVARSCNGETFSVVASTPLTSWSDNGSRAGGTSYVYKVRAVDAAGEKRSRFTEPEAAPATPFEPVVPRRTRIRADHVTQLQAAANQLRIAAGLGAKQYAPLAARARVKASHFSELQTDINQARVLLNRGTWPFTTVASGQRISGRVVDELRDAVRACTDENLTQASE